MSNEVSSTTAAYFPYTALEALDSIDARLAALGWRKATARLMPPIRGFVEERPVAIERPEYLCTDTAFILRRAMVRPRDSSLVTLTYGRAAEGRTPCSQASDAVHSRVEDTPMPMLEAPRGQRIRSPGLRGSGGAWEAQAETSARLNVEATLRHYGAQIMTAGWTALGDAVTDVAGIATFQLRAPDGKTWLGVLSVIAPLDRAVTSIAFRVQPM